MSIIHKIVGWLERKKDNAFVYERKVSQMNKRELDGKYSVVKNRCPSCGHHKAFKKSFGLQCTRCKYVFNNEWMNTMLEGK